MRAKNKKRVGKTTHANKNEMLRKFADKYVFSYFSEKQKKRGAKNTQ